VCATPSGAVAPALQPSWIEAPRQHATDAALRAAGVLARHLVASREPDQAAAVLDDAITVVDPFSEDLYAQLIRLHQD